VAITKGSDGGVADQAKADGLLHRSPGSAALGGLAHGIVGFKATITVNNFPRKAGCKNLTFADNLAFN
jgi:hypothetical protein